MSEVQQAVSDIEQGFYSTIVKMGDLQKWYNQQKGIHELHEAYQTKALGQLHLLLSDSESMLQKQLYAETMVENLINDLLDLAKLENHSFTLTQEYFSLSQVVFEAFQMMLFTANESGIMMVAEVDSYTSLDMIHSIHGDQRRYLQILLNFISNSLKFTNKDGQIRVSLRILDNQPINNSPKKSLDNINAYGTPKKNLSETKLNSEYQFKDYFNQAVSNNSDMHFINLEISVTDTGVGISEEGLSNLFIDFHRLEENLDRNKAGTGLGLSICKKIIEQMGGSVDVRSELDVGTSFIIKLKTKCKMKETILEQQPFNEGSHSGNSPIEIIKVNPDSRELQKIFKS